MSEQVEVAASQSIDSFDNVTPIPLPSKGGDNSSDSDSSGLDTFDNMEVKTLDQEDDGGEKQEQEKEKQEPQIKRETDKLEDQESDSDDEQESKKDDDGKDGDDKAPEKAESDTEKDSGDKSRGKTIRIKDGDKAIDIDPEATIPVKVKGKKEFVSIQELQKNYSGQKAWSEEIQTAKAKNSELEKQVEQFEGQKQQTREHFAKLGKMIEDAYTNPEADPLSFAKHLIDLSGRDVLQYEQKLMEHYGNLANEFADMTEAEQKLYWAERKNQIFEDNQAARAKEVEQRTAEEQRQQNISKVRESYGISEEDYNATEQELEDLGYDLKQVTPDQVSKWAALKPHVSTAEELCGQFEDDLGDADMEALITKTADTLYSHKNIDPIEALKFSAKALGFEITHEEEVVRELEKKITEPESRAEKRKPYKASNDGYESFDDYDD